MFNATSYPEYYSDTEIDSLLQELLKNLDPLPDDLPAIQSTREKGLTLTDLCSVPPQEQEAFFEIACQLCDADYFQHAAVIALQLVVHQPNDCRFAFLAGSCMQRLGFFHTGGRFYQQTFSLRKVPVAMYRLGECLAALGEKEEALKAFNTTFDMCRGREELRHLQDRAAAGKAALNTI